jgi:hypothetical protein
VSFPHPITFRNIEKKKNKKKGVKAPPLSPLLAMVGSKIFPLNYTHKHQKKKKEKKWGTKAPPSIGNGGPKDTHKHRKNKTKQNKGESKLPHYWH